MTKFFGARVCPKDHPQRAGTSVGMEIFKPLRLVLQTQPRSVEEFCPAPGGRAGRAIQALSPSAFAEDGISR
jgi:hypothetical protein